MSAPEVLFRYLGSPEVEGAAPLAESVPCWLCAGVAKAGMSVRKWIGPAFTSHSRDRFPLSKTICAGSTDLAMLTSGKVGELFVEHVASRREAIAAFLREVEG